MNLAPRNKLRPIHALSNKTVRLRREYSAEPRRAIPHIRLKERMDLNPLLICLNCKAEIEVDYSVPNMHRRRDAFCDEHEDCKPKEEA